MIKVIRRDKESDQMDKFSFLPGMKQPLGNGKSKYNTDRNCSGDFECFHSPLW